MTLKMDSFTRLLSLRLLSLSRSELPTSYVLSRFWPAELNPFPRVSMMLAQMLFYSLRILLQLLLFKFQPKNWVALNAALLSMRVKKMPTRCCWTPAQTLFWLELSPSPQRLFAFSCLTCQSRIPLCFHFRQSRLVSWTQSTAVPYLALGMLESSLRLNWTPSLLEIHSICKVLSTSMTWRSIPYPIIFLLDPRLVPIHLCI
jgi:hypothetical protein